MAQLTYYIYYLITGLFTPFIAAHFLYRVLINKEDRARILERFGGDGKEAIIKNRIWFHAASVGELNSICSIINGLEKKGWKILVTTGTLSSAKIFKAANFKYAVHKFIPADSPFFVAKFLRIWQPSIAIFVDSELWPNLIVQTSKQTKLLLLNGRLSDRSFARWLQFKSLAAFLLNKFTVITPTSKDDQRKFSHFAQKKKLKYIGDLKLGCTAFIKHPNFINELQKNIGQRKIWIAACTHPGEEEQVLIAHKQLLSKHPGVLLILIPRNPSRGVEISRLVKKFNLEFSTRFNGELPNKICDVFIIAKIGEIEIYYELADVVFMGGSLVNHGGHNIREPARHKCAIIVGPYTQNFKELVNAYIIKKAIKAVSSADELASKVIDLLQDSNKLQQLKTNAFELAKPNEEIIYKAIKLINLHNVEKK